MSKRNAARVLGLLRNARPGLLRRNHAAAPDGPALDENQYEIGKRQPHEDRQQLIRSRQHYAALYEDAPVAYLVLDREGRILQANLMAASLLGTNRGALAGATLSDFATRESRSRLEHHCEVVFGGKGHQRCRLEMIRQGGSRLCVQVESIAFGPENERRCRTAVIDTTNYERMEEILQSLAEKLETRVADRTGELRKERGFSDAIIDKLPGIVLILDRESHLLRSNITPGTAAGSHSAAPQSGSGWMGFIPANEQETLQEWLAAKLLHEATQWPQEIMLSHRDGSLHVYRFTSTVLKDANKQIDSLVCFGTDITDQRSAEADARQYLDEAARLQRLQTASELATAMGHELNQPFGAITMYADSSRQLLERPRLNHERLMENMDSISEQSLRGSEIIQRLRRFINKKELELEPLDLNVVIRKACSLMMPKARDLGVRIELRPCEDRLPVSGVAIHLEQVLLNLLSNAIEAIQDAGMFAERVSVEVRPLGQMARVTVRDTGPGIGEEDATQMLKFLHSTKEYGLGVGLCISSSLIRAHGGRLWIEPQQPGGVVHFELPLSS